LGARPRDPVEQLAQDSELMVYQYYGFWSCMDTLKAKNMLKELWNSGKAPWKIW
jgi:glucose-1-phosphate cytidylyltransferase